MKQKLILDDRMSKIAAMVREGATVADVGCDHGYISLWLLDSGRAKRVIACDINSGPLDTAEKNAHRFGFNDRMDFVLSDGLDALDCNYYEVTDVVIAGMGGEMIADIVTRCEYLRRETVRLILQPMTFAAHLRKILSQSGFRITEEELATDGKRIYQIISAAYDGVIRSYTDSEYILGPLLVRHRNDDLFSRHVEKQKSEIEKRKNGLEAGGHEAADELRLLRELSQYCT